MGIFKKKNGSKTVTDKHGKIVGNIPGQIIPGRVSSIIGGRSDCAPSTDDPFQDWGTGEDFCWSKTEPTVEAPVPDYRDQYRYGAHGVVHAQIESSANEIINQLHSQSSGSARTNFNPSSVSSEIVALAASVLDAANGNPGKMGYERYTNVYSTRTVNAAERIIRNGGTTTFDEQVYQRESTTWFPCEVNNTPSGREYKYSLHPTLGDLVFGAADDIAKNEALQDERKRRIYHWY